jgi:hypothetical protein
MMKVTTKNTETFHGETRLVAEQYSIRRWQCRFLPLKQLSTILWWRSLSLP